MSDIHPGTPRDDADDSPFTVEDTGSTTDAADLVGGERARQHDAAFGGDDDASRVTSTEPMPTTDGGGAHAVGSGDAVGSRDTVGSGDAVGSRDTVGSGDTVGSRDTVDTSASVEATDAATDGGGGLTALDDDGSIAHVFDQTNGVIDGLEGESDGEASGDEESLGDRSRGAVPIGQQDAFEEDHYGREGERGSGA
ncbi:hypothetical protein [uncultured Amnibacterium sp.]|uniref:hypothetical protein n=1 Tax=uncultured Amnibacterium sp. TaxID=1631851 RepID=UPI0035CBBD9C